MQLAVFESLTFNAPRSLRRAYGVVWFSICLLSAPLMAQDFSNEACANAHDKNQESLAPNRQILEASPLPNRQPKRTIHHIELVQLNVFNTDLPEENNALFRFANRAHIQTEAEVIKQVLLFQEGDEYLPEKLMESERLLRQQRYLYDARIYADVACEGDIHVTVVTRDLWTLLPDLGFSHSGGESKSRIGFRETNLLGKGKRLSLTYTTDESRKGYLFVYEDPNIWELLVILVALITPTMTMGKCTCCRWPTLFTHSIRPTPMVLLRVQISGLNLCMNAVKLFMNSVSKLTSIKSILGTQRPWRKIGLAASFLAIKKIKNALLLF
ncbi:hypothetical protein [Pseudoalteromonas xiamenensis]|uniref:hypothetical protein n=1 Tax=Pseudoalteromonas xiamenensis TaxID=882626 RepID=UPI003138260B